MYFKAHKKRSFFDLPTPGLQDNTNWLLLFRQVLSFSAYTTAVASLRQILHIGLLPSGIGCAFFITFQDISKSMSLRFKPQTYFESSVLFLYLPPLKYFFRVATRLGKTK